MLSTDSSYIGLNSSHTQDYSNTLPEVTSLHTGSALIHLGSGVKKCKEAKKCKVALSGQSSAVAQNYIPRGSFRILLIQQFTTRSWQFTSLSDFLSNRDCFWWWCFAG